MCEISTGVFGYPQESAAHVAMQTTKKWLEAEENQGCLDLVVFNVFTPKDLEIYVSLLENYFPSRGVVIE